MNQEKELERHNQILEQIKNANTKEELPRLTTSTLAAYFASNIYFDDRHISSSEFLKLANDVICGSHLGYQTSRELVMDILKKNYPGKEENEYISKYIEIARLPRTYYLVDEIVARIQKIKELEDKRDLNNHNIIMKQIDNAFEIEELPKVTKAFITKHISSLSKTEYNDRINVSKLNDLADLLLKGYSIDSKEVDDELIIIAKSENEEHVEEIEQQLKVELFHNKKLKYLIEEVNAKEKRTKFIYKNNHEEIMTNIRDARRISQLPPNLSMSTITGYLSGNSTIYKNGDKIPSGAFVKMAELFIKGKTFGDREIIDELARIILEYYPEKLEEAFMLLIEKLSSLPNLDYRIEEVREALKKQKEFIARGGSNVNVYFVPNPKSPMDAGKFYNVYISRAKNLDLEDILPLQLDNIVPKEMDVDSIEWYVQEYHDPTFKTAGGIILNKDEAIGNVNIFQPSDGKIGITPEEKTRYQELEDLSKQVKEVIARKKKETSDFAKLQEAFLKSQQATDEELAALEAKIDLLTQERKDRGGRK